MKLKEKPFKGVDGYYHYVYETTNLINGKKYIGKHSTRKLDDGYIGCGVTSQKSADRLSKTSSGFPSAIVKYGYKNFNKQIISFFRTPEEAFSFEEKIVNKSIVKSSLYYNIITGGGNRHIGKVNNKFKGTKNFIEESNEVHGDLYDYSCTEYKGANSKLKIICKKHGIFEQRAACHLRGHGCKKCAGLDKKDTEYFIKKSKEVYGDLYEYSLTKYINAREKVKITCKNHGIFEQKPSDHYTGSGCPECRKT